MSGYPKSVRVTTLRLLAVLSLLGCPQIPSAAGTWSVIPLPQRPGEVISPTALAVDALGNLYVADDPDGHLPGRIQKRDARGNWLVLTVQVGTVSALAVDPEGNLYAAEGTNGGGPIRMRDTQGNWSVIAPEGEALGQVWDPSALAVDTGGNLYAAELLCGVCDVGSDRIQKRDAHGNWSVIATSGSDPGQVNFPHGLAVDAADNLYVADIDPDVNGWRIQKRDAQGKWSVIATGTTGLGQVTYPFGLALDGTSNLYLADVLDLRACRESNQGDRLEL